MTVGRYLAIIVTSNVLCQALGLLINFGVLGHPQPFVVPAIAGYFGITLGNYFAVYTIPPRSKDADFTTLFVAPMGILIVDSVMLIITNHVMAAGLLSMGRHPAVDCRTVRSRCLG